MDNYGDKLNEMHAIIEKALPAGAKRHVFYSAYPTSEKTDNPLNNLKKVAIRGKVVMFANSDCFWGGENSQPYVGKVLTNPTWLDIAVEANKMIAVTGDFHHIFLEGVSRTTYREIFGKPVAKDVKIYEFLMGS